MIKAEVTTEIRDGIEVKNVKVELNGTAFDLIDEASNMINHIVWDIQKNMEEVTGGKVAGEKTVTQIFANVVGSHMQKSIDGEFDINAAERFIDSAWEFIDGNITLNQNKDKVVDTPFELLGIDKESAGEPDEETEQEDSEAGEPDGEKEA